MLKWLNEWWEETKRISNDPRFRMREHGVNDVSAPSIRPPPPKGQDPNIEGTNMDMEKLNEAITEAQMKLGQPFNPSKYSGDYKYWSGLLEARKLLLESNASD